MARYREYIVEKNKKLSPKKRYQAGAQPAPRTETEERAALRAEYFRVARARHRPTAPRKTKVIDAW